MADTVDRRTWGVSLGDVVRLAPQVSVLDGDATGGTPPRDAEYGTPERVITSDDVLRYVRDVAARVTARVVALQLDAAGLGDALTAVAADAVKNGAAAYLVDAAFPARSGVNDLSSYGQVLWARYREALDELQALADMVKARGGAVGEDGQPAPILPASSAFPPTVFPDAQDGGRW